MPKRSLTVNDLGNALMSELKKAGWEVFVEDDYEDFENFFGHRAVGILEAFTRVDMGIMSLNRDLTNVEILFHFYADPNKIGSNKRAFGKRIRENGSAALKAVCAVLLAKAKIKVEEEVAIWVRPKAQYKFDFSSGEPQYAAYQVEMSYWKKPEEDQEPPPGSPHEAL